MLRTIHLPRTGRGASLRDLRLWVGVTLIVGSAVAGNLLVRGMSEREPAVVVLHDLAAGTQVTAADVRAASVSVPTGTDLVSSVAQLEGMVTNRPLAAGELVSTAAVGGTMAATARVVSLPIKAGHLPLLVHGSVVEVWMTPSAQGMELPGPARLVVERALVVSAPDSVDATTDAAVTLQIDAMDVSALETALRDGIVDVALVPGGAE